MTILVAEDESGFSETFESILKSKGHDVDLAVNGKQAIQLLETKNYDVAFLDFGMPDYTGLDVLDYIKKSGKKTKTVIMTAYPLERESIVLKAGADEFLNKPFSFADVERMLSKFLL